MLTKAEFKAALRQAGLDTGDCLVVHSSLRPIGPMDGGGEMLIDALLEALGGDGTLVMPTFCSMWSFREPLFDPATSPSTTGILSELFRRRPGARRSFHPTHSIAALGPLAESLVAGHLAVPCVGVGSPLDKLVAAGGKVLLLGVTHTANTTIHVGEGHAGVEKIGRWGDEAPPRMGVRLPEGQVIQHALDTSASCSSAFNVIDLPLRRAGGVADLVVGRAIAHLMRGKDVIAATVAVCRDYPGLLFCTRPDCVRCTLSRARIRPRTN